jgi:predicted lipid-binding transport protein (Tim44 family)
MMMTVARQSAARRKSMRRSVFVSGILALFVASLALAAVAEARVGRGSSSGSRGSRSFSAPRSPSTPSSPASPTSPQRNLSSPTQRPGGFLGGFGGMLGGFLLGGLIGGLLFGGLGHGFGGIGLMDMLLIGGLIALAVMFFRRRQQTQPAYAGAAGSRTDWTSGRSDWGSAQTSAAEPMAAGAATTDRDLEDYERGLEAIRMMDSGFTPVRFAAHARDMFVRLQAAWSARDLAPIRRELTDELASSLQTDIDHLKAQRRTNRLERVMVESAEPTEAWQETGQDFVTIRFRANALDYTLDDATGTVVEGSQTSPASFEEFWTFTRPVGPNPWRLSAIQQPG